MYRVTRIKIVVITIASVLLIIAYINMVNVEQIPDSNQIVNSENSNNRIGWLNPESCHVNCKTGIPCEYPDEVDFRIIVMTYNRPWALNHSLNALLNLDTLNDKISVEIWIDRSKDGKIDNGTLKVAQSFVSKIGRRQPNTFRACIHKQNSNAYIGGQWVFTWRPKQGSRELGLILEDDVVVSPLSYKWIKMLHLKYGHETNIAGYTLSMEGITFFSKVHNKGAMKGPAHQQVFLYPVIGTWGFAPHPESWRKFQDWYLKMRPNRDVKTDKIQPFVPGIVPDGWYRSFLQKGTQESMWEMWHIKFSDYFKLFNVYPNLYLYTKRQDVLLCNNRREAGLHYGGGGVVDNSRFLLRKWNRTYENLPPYKDLAHFNYNGSPCTKKCCFNTSCLTGKE